MLITESPFHNNKTPSASSIGPWRSEKIVQTEDRIKPATRQFRTHSCFRTRTQLPQRSLSVVTRPVPQIFQIKKAPPIQQMPIYKRSNRVIQKILNQIDFYIKQSNQLS
ncbi:hypothetical protein pb186bvf_001518 [Paramecium bursaria]